MYAKFHQIYLSKRLLNGKLTSMDMEKHVITKLKLSQVPQSVLQPPFASPLQGH